MWTKTGPQQRRLSTYHCRLLVVDKPCGPDLAGRTALGKVDNMVRKQKVSSSFHDSMKEKEQSNIST